MHLHDMAGTLHTIGKLQQTIGRLIRQCRLYMQILIICTRTRRSGGHSRLDTVYTYCMYRED